MPASLLLQPVFALMLLTCIVTVLMYISRVGAMKKLRIHPQKGQDTQQLKQLLPAEVNRISNNYNHLFEQPVIFYAVCLSMVLLQHIDMLTLVLAWLYVGLRVIHSAIQITIDKVMFRFTAFIFSWIVLATLIAKFGYALYA